MDGFLAGSGFDGLAAGIFDLALQVMVGHRADGGVGPDVLSRLDHVDDRVDRQDDTHEAERCAEGAHEREGQEVAAHRDTGIADAPAPKAG